MMKTAKFLQNIDYIEEKMQEAFEFAFEQMGDKVHDLDFFCESEEEFQKEAA